MNPAELLNGLFDLLLAPFGSQRWLGLAFVSILTGILLLWLFKLVTPQQRLKKARGRLLGHLYEMGLYQDDLGVLFRIQGALALANLRYVTLTLPALIVLLPPVILTLVQLEARYQHPALAVGETLLVRVEVTPERKDLLNDLHLEPADGLSLDSPAVRDRSGPAVWWRVRVENEGWHELVVSDGADGRWTKLVKAAEGLRPISLHRDRAGLTTTLLNPAAPALAADGPLVSLAIHPPAEPDWWLQPWFWGFCLFSVLGGLAVKRWLRVEM